MLDEFRLCILFFVLLSCVFAKKLKAEDIDTGFPSLMRGFLIGKEFSVLDESGKVFLLRAHLSLFLTQNQIVLK